MGYFVYIIKCSDDYLYTGITYNLKKRLAEHNSGLSKSTKNRVPVKLEYSENFLTRIEAAQREQEIKGWSRRKKEDLINSRKSSCKFTPNAERRP